MGIAIIKLKMDFRFDPPALLDKVGLIHESTLLFRGQAFLNLINCPAENRPRN